MENAIKLTPAQRGRMFGLIRRLESGKYTQGKGALKLVRPDGKVENCCLGVACQMLVDNKILRWSGARLGGTTYKENLGSTRIGVIRIGVSDEDADGRQDFSAIPLSVEGLFGFHTLDEDKRLWQSTYWRLNDDMGYDFIAIAAELRKNFGFKPRAEVVKNETA